MSLFDGLNNYEIDEDKIKNQFLTVANYTTLVRNTGWSNDVAIDKNGHKVNLCKDNIRVTELSKDKKNAHMGSVVDRRKKSVPTILLGINPDQWQDATPEQMIQIMNHEAYHIRFPNHRPDFWKHSTESLCQMYEFRNKLKPAFGLTKENKHYVNRLTFSWKDVLLHHLNSIHESSVDNRIESSRDRYLRTIGHIRKYGKISAFFDDVQRVIEEEKRLMS